jgi:hypothetical protein
MTRAKILVPSILVAFAIAQGCTVTTTGGPADGGADGSSGSSGSSGAVVTGCAFGEPNDTRETAFPIAAGTYLGACLEKSTAGDKTDFYSFSAPAGDKAGGFVTVKLSNIQKTDSAILVYDAQTNEEFGGDHHSGIGEDLKVWFAVRPGRKYNILVQHYVNNVDGVYDMTVAYTKADDAYEANNTRETAAAVPYGTPVEATFLATLGMGDENEAVDWYKMDIPVGGKISAAVSNVPTDSDLSIKILNSGFAVVADDGTGTKGSNFSVSTNRSDLPAGTYYFALDRYVNKVAIIGDGEPADHLTRKYSFSVGVASP